MVGGGEGVNVWVAVKVAVAVGVKLGGTVFVKVGLGVAVSVGAGVAVGRDVAVALGLGVGWLRALQAPSKMATKALTKQDRIVYPYGGFCSYLTIAPARLFNFTGSIDLRLLHCCRERAVIRLQDCRLAVFLRRGRVADAAAGRAKSGRGHLVCFRRIPPRHPS